MDKQTSRNDPCPCGSGKKYKKCCINKSIKRKVRVIASGKNQVHSKKNDDFFAGDNIKGLMTPSVFEQTQKDYREQDSQSAALSSASDEASQSNLDALPAQSDASDRKQPNFFNPLKGNFDMTDKNYLLEDNDKVL